MEAILFALVSFFGWGVGDLFTTQTARKLNAYGSAFWTEVVSVILLSLYIPFALNDLSRLTGDVFILNILLSIFFMTGIILFREALIKGSSPVIVVIASSNAAIVTLLSIIVFQEKLTLLQQFSIALVFVGLFLSLLDIKHLLNRKIKFGAGVGLAMIAAVLFGIYFTFIKIPVRELGWFWPNYFSFILFLPCIYLYIKFKKIKLNGPNFNGAAVPLLLGVALNRMAELTYNAGIGKGYTSIVAPIAGANPVLFVLLAPFIFKDHITKQQILGVVLTLVGVVALSIVSV